MSELIKSFLAIALCGSLLGIIIPENKLEKSITFLTSTVMLIAMLTIFGDFTKTIDLKNIDFNYSESITFEMDMQQEAIRGIKYSLENEVINSVKQFCGEKPLNIKTEVVYEEEEFKVNYIKLYIRNADEAALIEHIQKAFNIDKSKTEIIVIITESAYTPIQ